MTKSGVITMSRSNIRDWRIRQIIYFQPKNPSNRVAKLANFLDWDPKKEDLYPAIIVAVMVAVMVANTAIMQRLCSDYAGPGLIATGSRRRRGYIEL